MTDTIEEILNNTKEYKEVIGEIREEIEISGKSYTIETLLSMYRPEKVAV